MADEPTSPAKGGPDPGWHSHYRELFRQTLSRQVVLYFLPLVLLAVFFHLEYGRIIRESDRAHLEIIAEHQANTLDLFLRERLVNLANVIDDPAFRESGGGSSYLRSALEKLRLTSQAFGDLATVGARGELIHSHGPDTIPGPVNYENESWFRKLIATEQKAVITDIYLGFRNRPHFTIAVKRSWEGKVLILRSTLSPERINDFLTTLEGAREVNAFVVNEKGVFQVVTTRVGKPLERSKYNPPRELKRGHVDASESQTGSSYAFQWLQEVPWSLIVENAPAAGRSGGLTLVPGSIFLFTGFFLVGAAVVIFIRARQLVRKQLAVEEHEAELSGQLVQAAKLASVGELAAGIAHEINNPLAIIAEETGLLKDMLNPELAEEGEELNLEEHLDIIYNAVFRCRDITRKLLTFVRQTEVKLESHDIHMILDDVLDGMLGNELAISNVKLLRHYDPQVRKVVTDRNQLVQVIVNLVKNAIDAMGDGGLLTVRTRHKADHLVFLVKDTGCGMTPEQLEKVFMPFFTTKEPGKGTGLGLSVSFSIIKHFGGNMYVDSTAGKGSTFTVELPYTVKD
ncbi:MAG: sensor histidine kinase [Planctomycetota bacterium]